jgi:hypothetical protein
LEIKEEEEEEEEGRREGVFKYSMQKQRTRLTLSATADYGGRVLL